MKARLAEVAVSDAADEAVVEDEAVLEAPLRLLAGTRDRPVALAVALEAEMEEVDTEAAAHLAVDLAAVSEARHLPAAEVAAMVAAQAVHPGGRLFALDPLADPLSPRIAFACPPFR